MYPPGVALESATPGGRCKYGGEKDVHRRFGQQRMNRPVVAVAHGLDPSPAPLHQGGVYRVGRPDRAWLKQHGDDGYLALSRRSPATIPVVALVFTVGREFVEARLSVRVAAVDIDGRPLGREPERLSGSHEITVDPHGSAQRFRLVCAARLAPPEPVLPSGTTVVPFLDLRGPRLRSAAAALAWPLVGGVPQPLTWGWSTGAVEGRYRELFGEPPRTPMQRTLYDLRDRLVKASGPDGRPLATVPELQPWPWDPRWERAGFLTEQAFFDFANRCTAGHLANNSWLRDELDLYLDRPR